MTYEGNNRPSKYGKRWIVGLCFGIATLLVAVWFASQPASTPPAAEPSEDGHAENVVELSPEARRAANLTIAPVEERPMAGVLVATGVVTAEHNRLAHIRPLAQGVVEQVLAQMGDRVSAGQPLLTYDNIELGELIGEYLTLQAETKKEQSQVEVARSYLNRSEALLAVDAIAQKEHELRKAQFDQAIATVESKRAEMARVEEKLHRFGMSDSELRSMDSGDHDTHRTASHNTLTAPFAGVITGQDVAAGESIGPDREAFTLADTSVVWVLADIYEKDLGLVIVGQSCRVRVPAYPETVFTGIVAYLSDVLDPTSRTGKLRCLVANADARLKLEMFATVEIALTSRRNAVVVPESAVQMVEQKKIVFVVRQENQFEARTIELGERSGDRVEVRSGLRAGEAVVAEGAFNVKAALLQEQLAEGGDHD